MKTVLITTVITFILSILSWSLSIWFESIKWEHQAFVFFSVSFALAFISCMYKILNSKIG